MNQHDPNTTSRPPAVEPFHGSYSNPACNHSFEIHVGDDGIAYGISKGGTENLECALGLRKLFLEVKAHLGRRYDICLDISRLEGIDPEARKVWSETAMAEDSPFARVAIHGGSFFLNSLMNFYARLAHMPVRLFRNQEEAVAWLKEETR